MTVHDYDFDPTQDGEAEKSPERRRFGMAMRLAVAAVIAVLAVMAECMVMAPADEAVVITRLGNPVRVLTRPGLAWKLPAPIETVTPIDLRLRTTSTGLQDVGTRDGLRVLVQAYTAWQVPNDPQHIRQFLRALRNQPDEGARQLRSFVTAAMHITASNFNLSDLVNSDPRAVKIGAFEQQLRSQVAQQMLQGYGIEVRQVGVERLTLPAATLAATVARMSAERETVAAARTADGLRRAAQIQADADRDGRELVANAQKQAAQVQSDAEVAAAAVYAKAYRADPGLYTTLRSLDAVNKVVGPNTNLVLRTDAAPFKVLSQGPAGAAGGPGPAMTDAVARAAPPDPGGPTPAPLPGPITQSVTIGFKVVYVVTLLLAVLWFASNFRIISSDSQAVVMRFGRIVRTQQAGLLLAWPRPIEQVRLLPGPDRQLSRPVAALPPVGGISPASSDASGDTVPPGAQPYLTGDGNVVLLDATLVYRITDPTAYVLEQAHLDPALDRLFRATTVDVAAKWGLNDFLVAQPMTGAGGGQTISALRGVVRDDLLSGMNARLKMLSAQGAGLGVEVDRIDLTAWLPPEAKLAFDEVLTASQKADQDVAAANTAAELRRQGAQREADRVLSAAQAAAIETTVSANVDTSNIAAIERTPGVHLGLEQQAYRNSVGDILRKAGSVIAVAPRSGARFIMAGRQKPVAGPQQ